MSAARDTAGKPPLAELHWHELGGLAWHVVRGRMKYPDVRHPETGLIVPNWTLGGKPNTEYLNAIERHAKAIVLGEVYAADTGTRHCDAIAWNALTLGTLNLTGYPLVVSPVKPIEPQYPPLEAL